jgi:hypothetical protein
MSAEPPLQKEPGGAEHTGVGDGVGVGEGVGVSAEQYASSAKSTVEKIMCANLRVIRPPRQRRSRILLRLTEA